MATKRIQLLSEPEIADIYNRPDFNNDERELYIERRDQYYRNKKQVDVS